MQSKNAPRLVVFPSSEESGRDSVRERVELGEVSGIGSLISSGVVAEYIDTESASAADGLSLQHSLYEEHYFMVIIAPTAPILSSHFNYPLALKLQHGTPVNPKHKLPMATPLENLTSYGFCVGRFVFILKSHRDIDHEVGSASRMPRGCSSYLPTNQGSFWK